MAGCFCADPRLTAFSAGPTGVCDGACTNPNDLASIQGWYTSFCAQQQQGGVKTAAPTAGAKSSGGGGGGSWYEFLFISPPVPVKRITINERANLAANLQALESLPMGHLPRHHGRRHCRNLGRCLRLAETLPAQEGPAIRSRIQPGPRHRVGPRRGQRQHPRLHTRPIRRDVPACPYRVSCRLRREDGQGEEELAPSGPVMMLCGLFPNRSNNCIAYHHPVVISRLPARARVWIHGTDMRPRPYSICRGRDKKIGGGGGRTGSLAS